MIDIVLAMLKFGGLILTGVFGAYGLLVKFKDENGKVTMAGRNALVLIVASTIIGGLSASFELYRDSVRKRTVLEAQAKETLETAKRTETLLSEINRSLQPISGLIIDHWIGVPTDHLGLKQYISRFDAELPNALNLLRSTGHFPGNVGGAFDQDGNPTDIEFASSATLAPNPKSEELAFTVLGYSEISLEFFKSPIDPKLHPLISGNYDSKPDLEIRLTSGLDVPGLGGNHDIEYNLKDKAFRLRGSDISSDSKYWKSTGKLVSIPDLAGSQLFIELPSIIQSGNAEVNKFLPEIRKGFSLDTIILNFGKGREFWLKAKNLKKLENSNGLPLYVYTFPNSVDDLNKLSR